MTSILKVSEIQDPTNSNTALTIDSSGNVSFSNPVSNAIQSAVFVRYTNGTGRSSNTFHTREFDAISSGSITGASVNGSGHASLPAGTYIIQYNTTAVNNSTAQGETVSRLYDHTAGAVVANSYSVRSTQAADGTDSGFHAGSIVVTFASAATITVQTMCENATFDDVNTFDGSPGNTLGVANNQKNVEMIVIKIA